jgi:hypothetical protein
MSGGAIGGITVADQYLGASDAEDSNRGLFRPDQLDRSIIAVPLLAQLAERSERDSVSVVFDLNLLFPRGDYASGLAGAGARVVELLERVQGPGIVACCVVADRVSC